MPYIKQSRRDALFNDSTVDFNSNIENAGELNYFITEYIIEYVRHKGESYQTFNDVSGALTECLAEFRRRVIAPYEDKKIKENTDVYPKPKKRKS
jgi:hypothetical protein